MEDIPKYIQSLFVDRCDYGIDYIWINKSEFAKCIPDFKLYFKRQSSNWWSTKKTLKYGKWAKYMLKIGNRNVRIVTPPEIEWNITDKDLDLFWKNHRIDGPQIKCHIGHVINKNKSDAIIDEEEEDQDKNCILLYPQCSRHSKYHDNRFKFEIDIKSKPEYIHLFEYEVQWEIAKIQYTFEATHKSTGSGVYYEKLFDSKKLKRFNIVDQHNKQKGFCLNIIIKIISCKDKTGKDIQTLPHT